MGDYLEPKFYLVGGIVRDQLLGVPSNDVDIACEASSFEAMVAEIERRGGKIYLPRPEYFAVRCKMPFRGEMRDVDCVLTRRDGFYADGRRPSSVEVGTIYDDLARRDVTVGAMAQDENGNIIDPHGGREDLKNMLLRCVGNPRERFSEDSIRLLRCVRFFITRGFTLHPSIEDCLRDITLLSLLKNCSVERIQIELYKCFKHDTLRTLSFLDDYQSLRNVIFHQMTARGLWLAPTLKEA